MQKLRIIAVVSAAATCALTLSVGAALAEDARTSAPAKPSAPKPAPAGVCHLHNL